MLRYSLVVSSKKIWIVVSVVQMLLKSETERKVPSKEQSANAGDQSDFATRPISNGAARNFLGNN